VRFALADALDLRRVQGMNRRPAACAQKKLPRRGGWFLPLLWS
jgi:hypothetical protein